MSNFEITQDQLDRYNAFEGMLDLMVPDTAYTKEEITATIEQMVEMFREERAESEKVETFIDRYPTRTQTMTNRELLEEIDRLEMSTMSGSKPLDRFDQMRHDFVKQELNQRRAYGNV